MTTADVIPYLYRFLRQRLPNCLWEGDRTQRTIALTFDDGPHPVYTPPLLDVLERHQVKATFFWLGAWVNQYPDLARSIYQRGHWIGLHSYDHRIFLGKSAQHIRQSLERTQAAIASACHIAPQTVTDVRPPYGICTRHTIEQLHQWGYRPVMWSVVPIDWTEPGVDRVTQRVIQHTQAGDIIVLHDGRSGGPSVAQTTDQIIPRLHAQNFQFITINDMWQNLDRLKMNAQTDKHNLSEKDFE